eukprot:6260577-Amphidinium_carterae.1
MAALVCPYVASHTAFLQCSKRPKSLGHATHNLRSRQTSSWSETCDIAMCDMCGGLVLLGLTTLHCASAGEAASCEGAYEVVVLYCIVCEDLTMAHAVSASSKLH